MKRRLPIYFLIDLGADEITLNLYFKYVNILLNYVKKVDNNNITYCSLITSGSNINNYIPLTKLMNFSLAPFNREKNLISDDEMLNYLEILTQKEVSKSTPETKGYWKPFVFIFKNELKFNTEKIKKFTLRKNVLIISNKNDTICCPQVNKIDEELSNYIFGWTNIFDDFRKTKENETILDINNIPPPPQFDFEI